jgi:hypothetical protein
LSKTSYQPDIFHHLARATIFPDQLRPAFCGQRLREPEILSQIDLAGLEALVKFQIPELKILCFYKHR